MSKPAPAVVDIRGGDYQFAYSGGVIKRALYERAKMLEQEYTDLLNNVRSSFPTDSVEAVIAAYVQTFTGNKSWKAEVLTTLSQRAAAIQEEIMDCRRAANGFSDAMLYKVNLNDLKDLGLGLLASDGE